MKKCVRHLLFMLYVPRKKEKNKRSHTQHKVVVVVVVVVVKRDMIYSTE